MADDLEIEIARIEDDIKAYNVKRAINRLSDLVASPGRNFNRDISRASTLLMYDYSQYMNLQIKGVVSDDDLSRLLKRIADVTLEVCDSLRENRRPELAQGAAPSIQQNTKASPGSPEPTLLPTIVEGANPTGEFDKDAVIDARGICRAYRASNFHLEPIDIKIMPGKILAIVGVNGSGKSTLLDILRGEVAPDGGTLTYPQLSRDSSDWTTIKSQIGFVAQRSRSWRGRVRENLEYAAALHQSRGADNQNQIDRLVARHGLALYEKREWNELSSGYRLRFDLVLARVHDPKLLILDEPLATLDLVSQQSFLFDLKQVAQRQQTAIIVTSQHLYEMEAIADDLLVLAGGKRVITNNRGQYTFFEVWWQRDKIVTERELLELFVKFDPRSVTVGTTACLIGFAGRPTLSEVVATADQQGLRLIYARDVTGSARVEMEHVIASQAI